MHHAPLQVNIADPQDTVPIFTSLLLIHFSLTASQGTNISLSMATMAHSEILREELKPL